MGKFFYKFYMKFFDPITEKEDAVAGVIHASNVQAAIEELCNWYIAENVIDVHLEQICADRLYVTLDEINSNSSFWD